MDEGVFVQSRVQHIDNKKTRRDLTEEEKDNTKQTQNIQPLIG